MIQTKRIAGSMAVMSILQLMLGFIAGRKSEDYDWIVRIGIAPLLTAGMGVVALRLWRAEWREMMWAGAGAVLINSILHAIASGTMTVTGGLIVLAFSMLASSGGAFLLPLFDPVARRQNSEETPVTRWKVVVATLPLLGIILLSRNDYNPVQLMVAGVILLILFGVAILLQGTAWKRAGIYFGATGMLLHCELALALLIASLPLSWHF